MAQVIVGSALISVKEQTDLAPELVKQLDPQGLNLVSLMMPHHDGAEMRMLVLFKLKGRDEPFEAKLTVPFSLADKLVKSIDLSQLEKVH